MFGGLSVLVAGVGLSIVAVYAVTRRTPEIGIRPALGAEPQHLVRLVLNRSLFVIVAGHVRLVPRSVISLLWTAEPTLARACACAYDAGRATFLRARVPDWLLAV